MINVPKKLLVEKIQSFFPFVDEEYFNYLAERLIEELDEQLEKTVSQWINGEKIEDIWIGKYCVNAILKIRGSSDIMYALEAMNAYIKDEEKGEMLIWRGIR